MARCRNICGGVVLVLAVAVFVVSILLGYLWNVEFMVFAFPLFITTLMCGIKCMEPCSHHEATPSQDGSLLNHPAGNNYGTMEASATESDETESEEPEERNEEESAALDDWLSTKESEGTSESDPKFCIVCLEGPRETVFKKCGHMAVCAPCAKRMEKCPICQRKGRAIKVFLV
eukprot:c21477_g1_i1.p1 GENE.c21477_g1_i1~~c21477_g1_i1.p1  ORF type:complete len:186 (+),score=38.24 c21477_g1_i1:39-560(+)